MNDEAGSAGEPGSPFPIDVVITWVDGDDPAHAAKRSRYMTDGVHPVSGAATRFSDRGEIGYAVASVLRFCPFVRQVFIVTDAQYPAVLEIVFDRHPDWRARVSVVDHKEIFGEHSDLLPVFSSRSIETMIHRVPGLAEHFLYLNDDIFIGRKLMREFFFQAGVPVLRGVMRPFPSAALLWLKSVLRQGARRAGYKEAQQTAARMLGRRRTYLQSEHVPHPMRRSTMERFLDKEPELLKSQVAHRFRSPEQFSPIGLANHLELEQNAPVAPPGAVGYIKPPRTERARRKIGSTLEALKAGRLDSLCVQSLDAMAREDQEMVVEALEHHYGRFQAPRG